MTSNRAERGYLSLNDKEGCLLDYPFESIFVETNGIRLHVMQAGPADGAVLLLLHGFPEFWYSWKRQIPYFAEKGYRVWAPDLRGYNKSDKPIEETGQKKVVLGGHDWGGFLAWCVAEQSPYLVEKLIICNVPLMSVMQRNLRRNPLQMDGAELVCSIFSVTHDPRMVG